MSVAHLTDLSHAISLERQEIRRRLKILRSAQAKEAAAEARGGFTPHEVDVAMAVYMLSNKVALATMYLQQRSLQRKRQGRDHAPHTDDVLKDMVLTWYLEADLDRLQRLQEPTDPDGQPAHTAHTAAVSFLSQHDVVAWVREANNKGVAPSVAQVSEMYHLKATRRKLQEKPLTSTRARRLWVQRFRRRWCLARRLAPTKPGLSAAAFASKVRL